MQYNTTLSWERADLGFRLCFGGHMVLGDLRSEVSERGKALRKHECTTGMLGLWHGKVMGMAMKSLDSCGNALSMIF